MSKTIEIECRCGSTEGVVDGDRIICVECDDAVRSATDSEMHESDDYEDEDEPNDNILAQQELEDFEGKDFYEDAGDPYDCEFDRGGDLETEGEDYSHEGCCDE